MKLKFLLPMAIALTATIAQPALANRLTFWRFDQSTNRLEFRTDTSVQPRARLLFYPTRLLVDLPGISVSGQTITRPLTGNYRSIRIGQFDSTTARLVLELQPGYTLDPKEIKFTGNNPVEWYATLPQPQRIADVPTLYPSNPPSPTAPPQPPR